MLLAAALIAGWVPARWFTADPRSLELVKGSPVNCLLLERAGWSPEFLRAAHGANLAVLAVIRTQEDAAAAAMLPFDGYVAEGESLEMTGKPVIALPPRRAIRFDSADAVLGTSQGVWPGIEVEHGGPKEAGPTGSAWIHTNTGFLRFVRAAAARPFWIGVAPPDEPLTISRYLQAVADAGAAGARWVIAIDRWFQRRLLDRETAALEDWKRLLAHVRFYEDPRLRAWTPKSRLALIQDVDSGGLVTGNLLDMLSVMNTPVRAARRVEASVLSDASLVVTLNPNAYTPEQKALIAAYASRGGRIVAGPRGWKAPTPADGRFQFNREEYREIEKIWPELHGAINRRNFGVRLFNVAGAVSHLLAEPGGRGLALHLVNYADYPLEAVTAFVEGRYRKATLLTPEQGPRVLRTFEAPEGTGIEIDRLAACGAVLIE